MSSPWRRTVGPSGGCRHPLNPFQSNRHLFVCQLPSRGDESEAKDPPDSHFLPSAFSARSFISPPFHLWPYTYHAHHDLTDNSIHSTQSISHHSTHLPSSTISRHPGPSYISIENCMSSRLDGELDPQIHRALAPLLPPFVTCSSKPCPTRALLKAMREA